MKIHKKILFRIGSILACVLLVAGLSLPVFAADEPTEEQPIDIILAQADTLNSLYQNFGINVDGVVNLLFVNSRDFTFVHSYTNINENLFTLPLGNAMSYIGGSVFEDYGRLSFAVYGDGVDPLYTFVTDGFYFDALTLESGTDMAFMVRIYSPNDETDLLCTITYFIGYNADGSLYAYLAGVITTDWTYEATDYSIEGYYMQFINPMMATYGIAPCLGTTVYPARDLQLNILQGGGGATEEELQEAYDEGYRLGLQVGAAAGEEIGYQNGYEVGVNRGETNQLGDNLIGATFSSIVDGLRSFVILEFPNGYSYNLMDIVTAVVAIGVFILFLKMFAGG